LEVIKIVIFKSCQTILQLKANADVSEEHDASVFRVEMLRVRLGNVERCQDRSHISTGQDKLFDGPQHISTRVTLIYTVPLGPDHAKSPLTLQWVSRTIFVSRSLPY
jgi:hypothetical protein